MERRWKIVLAVGVATALAGIGLSAAQMEGPLPPDGPMQGLMHSRSPLADRLLAEFDKNHDGKITHDEMNRTLYARFMAATHGAQTMDEDQFAALHLGEFRRHAAEIFRRLDWSGKGKLTLADYAAPERVRFMTMDKDGSGFVSCGHSAGRYANSYQDEDMDEAPPPSRKGRTNYRGGGSGLAAFCLANDLNKDGKVTRGELDAAIAKRFAAATHGGAVMTEDEFVADQEQDFRAANERSFKRLDKDRDGKLSLAEFSAAELKLFARLDKNHDGVLTADEMKSRSASRSKKSGKRSYY